MAAVLIQEEIGRYLLPERFFDWEGTERLVLDPRTPRELVAFCRQHNIKLILVPEVVREAISMPGPQAHELLRKTPFHYTGMFRELAQQNAEHGIYFASLWPRFPPDLARKYLVDRMHLNNAGYEYLARTLADILLERGLVPTAPKAAGYGEEAGLKGNDGK